MKSLDLFYHKSGDFLFINKPPGINTHRASSIHLGICDYIESELGYPLFLAHRLDKETSGALALGLTSEAAKALTEAFQNRRVRKTYLFLSTRPPSEKTDFVIQSSIEKAGSQFVSRNTKGTSSPPNSETEFQYLRKSGPYFLWSARPQTGKSHQIRLHALDAGIPILGDTEHGGDPFVRLCLHSESISFELNRSGAYETHAFSTPQPFWVNLDALSEGPSGPSQRAQWFFYKLLMAQERRESLFGNQPDPGTALRLIHQELDGLLRVDQMGELFWGYWYDDKEPSSEVISDLETWARLNGRPLYLRAMRNRGQDPNTKVLWHLNPNPHHNWLVSEGDMRFEIRTNTGLSPGLFLDHRNNRRWAQKHTQSLRVLNLFSYTGGFSIAAAKGGAQEVVSVDLSRKFLNWSRTNFEHSRLQADSKKFEFWEMDSFEFLQQAHRKGRKFDLIVCDPPSFSRAGPRKTFSIEKDLEKLFLHCLGVLAPQGRLFFSTNFEKWSRPQIEKRIRASFPHLRDLSSLLPPGCLDFELPGEEPLMKSFLYSKEPFV